MSKLFHDRWPTLCLALYAFGVAIWPVVAGLEVTVEDGFYYYKIAENIARGEGSTFDGRHPTNGYHPLWLLCLLPVFSAASTAAQALAFAKLAQAAAAALAAAILYRAARILSGRSGAVVAVLLWVELTHRLWLQGLEYALHALILTATLHVYLRWFRGGPPSPRAAAPWLVLGLGCALAFLARLDSLLLAAALGATLLAAGVRQGRDRAAVHKQSTVRRLALFAAPVAVAVLAYAAFNLHVFGHAAPVSGAVKLAWSQTLLEQQPFYQEHGWLLAKGRALLRPLKVGWGIPNLRPLVLGLTAIGVWLAAATMAPKATREWRQALRPLAPWAVCGVVTYVVYILWYHGSLALTPRYYAIQPILAALILATALDRLAGRLVSGRRALGAGLALLLILLTARGTAADIRAAQEGAGQPLVNAARWTVATLPADARIASWNAGTIAYLAGRQVVNLDGLVNSWEFFESGRRDICGYWRSEGITHLVDLFRNGESRDEVLPIAPVPVPVPCTGDLELIWLDDRYDPGWSVRAYRLRSWQGEP